MRNLNLTEIQQISGANPACCDQNRLSYQQWETLHNDIAQEAKMDAVLFGVLAGIPVYMAGAAILSPAVALNVAGAAALITAYNIYHYSYNHSELNFFR
ncbi:MAG: hypothetical protein HYX61_06130 [Gammaproteobacteria bacterium]|jgi:hypothetical protein|nr:hypothetical protein [Gammaproteobacteria bacterium]